MDNRNTIIDTIPVIDKKVALNYDKSMTPEQKINYLVQHLRVTINNHACLHDTTGARALDYKKFPFKNNKYDIEKDDFREESEAIVDLLRRLNWEKKE